MQKFKKKTEYFKSILSQIELRESIFEVKGGNPVRWDYHPFLVHTRDYSNFWCGPRRATLHAVRNSIGDSSLTFTKFYLNKYNLLAGYISQQELDLLRDLFPSKFYKM